MSEAHIFASINPQYDNRLIVHGITNSLHENYKRRTWAEHVLAMFLPCFALVVFMCRTGNSMNNPLLYCGLVDAKTSASDKYLAVPNIVW